VDEEPETQPLDYFFLTAFDDLNTCRHDGGPIPWRDIMVYGKEYVGLDHFTLKSFVLVVREMDRVFLDWHNEKTAKMKKTRPKPNATKAPRRRRMR
jgi:hypothetical protein